MTPDTRQQLEMQLAAIGRDAPPPKIDLPPLPVREPESFGAWLLAQRGREDWIDDLAHAARGDRGFPRHGSPDEVRDRLRVLGADGDAFEQVDDAERAWSSM